MIISGDSAARSAWRYAGLVALAVVLVMVIDPRGAWRAAAEAALLGIGLTAVPVAIRVHRTGAVAAWLGLASCLLFFALSSLVDIPVKLGGPPFLGVIEVALDVVAYGCLVAAAVAQLVAGRPRRDLETWADAIGLLLGGALAVVASAGTTGIDEAGAGLPLLTAVVLLVGVPLAFAGTSRSISAQALLVGGLCIVVGFGVQLATGLPDEATIFDDVTLFAVAAIVLAGRHPSVSQMGQRADAADAVTAGRVVGIGATLLVSPALLFMLGIHHGGQGYLLGVGSAALTGLALWRVYGLTRERELTRAALVDSEARLQLLMENAADVVAIVESGTGTVTYMSPAVQSLLGRPPAYFIGRNAIELADPRDQARLRAAVTAVGRAEGTSIGAVDVDVRLEHSSGGTRWVEMRLSGRVDTVAISGWVVNLREVTDRKLFEEELRRQARTDPLTGVLNRSAFSERLEAATAAIDPAAPPAVLFVDLDDFKAVNDSLGHAAGDDLLITVAARLAANVRTDDVVARLGGDEFAVLLTYASAERLRDVADRLVAGVREPMSLSGTVTSVTASIGGALGAPEDDAERLLHRADTAMYEAKRSGKDSRTLLVSPGR
ncbi:sensor domain-containing diguanylate cyclase [Blastococcus sp. CCUG 61487]|uniref:sensor domain-containing diguanylate cyclase n=1 Tax=Blastococcus sp. CCUG 61487 TaxID=1840703 RepID=UPI0010BFEB98|nr:sensor domain-containing diguanylate cyclase [Blastococcus sp. CCUG 61487]TKJ27418.1 hypothetical protein A6V29_03425 [Blastococcus sp. CCUG 61487]